MNIAKLEETVTRAVTNAMKEVGIEGFKKTSFFMSNSKIAAVKAA
ncbi:hypothetical protein SAMN05880593_12563 [Rhizobium sp. RU36D]|nr:hypothetical protein SAMN05880593_12563 [Rhizobium sp. RU36D]